MFRFKRHSAAAGTAAREKKGGVKRDLFPVHTVQTIIDALRRAGKNSLTFMPNRLIYIGFAEFTGDQANVAQLVERQLPKLDVAGSNPVIRSFLWEIGPNSY